MTFFYTEQMAEVLTKENNVLVVGLVEVLVPRRVQWVPAP